MLEVLKPRERSLYITLLINFAIMGAVVTVFGAAIPSVIAGYKWSYTDAGIVFAGSSAGFFLSSLTAGFLIERLGVRPVLATALAIEIVSLLFFARTPYVSVNLVLYFLIGIGLGTNELITNFTVVRIEERGKSRLMNLIHSAWCVGAILGPLGVANLIRDHLAWQVVFPTIAGLVLIMATFLMFQRFPAPDAERKVESLRRGEAPSIESGPSEKALTPAIPRAALFVFLCAAAIFVYIGVEKGVYNWISEYFVAVLRTPVALGASMVALYWTGQFSGRLLLSILYRGSRLESLLLVLCAASVFALFFLSFVHVVWLAVMCTFLAGFVNSGIFPVIISLTGKYSARGRSVGIVTAASGIAGILFPFVVAWVSEIAGMRAGFATVFFIAVLLTLLGVIIVLRAGRFERTIPEKLHAGGTTG